MTRSPRRSRHVGMLIKRNQQIRDIIRELVRRNEFLTGMSIWNSIKNKSMLKQVKKILSLRGSIRFNLICIYINQSRKITLSTAMLEGIDLRSAYILAHFWPSLDDLLDRLKNRRVLVRQLREQLRV